MARRTRALGRRAFTAIGLLCAAWCALVAPTVAQTQPLWDGGVWDTRVPLPIPNLAGNNTLAVMQDRWLDSTWYAVGGFGFQRWNALTGEITTIFSDSKGFTAIHQDDVTGEIYYGFYDVVYRITPSIDLVLHGMGYRSMTSFLISDGYLYMIAQLTVADTKQSILVFNVTEHIPFGDTPVPVAVLAACDQITGFSLEATTREILFICLDPTTAYTGVRGLSASNWNQPSWHVHNFSCTPSQAVRDAQRGVIFAACIDGGVHKWEGTEVSSVLLSDFDCGPAPNLFWLDRTRQLFVACTDGGAGAAVIMLQDDTPTILTADVTSCPGISAVGVDRYNSGLLLLGHARGISYLRGRDHSTVLAPRQCPGFSAFDVKSSDSLYSVCSGISAVLVVSGGVSTVLTVDDLCDSPVDVAVSQILNVKYLLCSSAGFGSYVVAILDDETAVVLDTPAGAAIASIKCMPDDALWMVAHAAGNNGTVQLWRMASPRLTGDRGFDLMFSTSTGISTIDLHQPTDPSFIYFASQALGVVKMAPTGGPAIQVISPSACQAVSLDSNFMRSELIILCTDSLILYHLPTSITQTFPLIGENEGRALRYSAVADLIFTIQGQSVAVIDRQTFTQWTATLENCPKPSALLVDSFSGVAYVACGRSGVLLALSSQWRCQSGFGWSGGYCRLCEPGQASGIAQQLTAWFPTCTPCLIGSVAPLAGTLRCETCQAGRYQYKLPGAILPSQTCIGCSPGRFQPTTYGTECFECPVGRYATEFSSSVCNECEEGSYQDLTAQGMCTQCSRGSASNVRGLNHSCPDCLRGTQAPQMGSTECWECPLGQFAELGSSCLTCPLNSYTPAIGSPCADCSGVHQDGLVCVNGLASIEAGWWAYSVPNSDSPVGVFHTTVCPPGYCPAASLHANVTHATPRCIFPRRDDPNNMLCAGCVDGYVAWGSSCVECTHANGGLITLILAFSFALVFFLLRSNRSSVGLLAILLYFVQIAALEIGPMVSWLHWLQFANPAAGSTNSCLMPLHPIHQQVLTLTTPFILAAVLTCIGCMHRIIQLNWSASLATPPGELPFFQRYIYFSTFEFNINAYFGGVVAILLFCYTPVTVAVVQSLNCVEVAPNVHLLFSMPTVDCNSTKYRSFLPMVFIWLAVYVLAFPLLVLGFLWRRHGLLLAAAAAESTTPYRPSSPPGASPWAAPADENDIDSASFRSSASMMSSIALSPSSSTSSSSHISVAFDLRYGAFFRGYTSRAWFWLPLVLLRRFAFALVSVLIPDASARFSTFALLHLSSLLFHLWTRPFRSDQLNHVETASYVLLAYVSIALAGTEPPYTTWLQVLVFFAIVPPALLLALWMARHHCSRLKPLVARWAAQSQSPPDLHDSPLESAESSTSSTNAAAYFARAGSCATYPPARSRPLSDAIDVEMRRVPGANSFDDSLANSPTFQVAAFSPVEAPQDALRERLLQWTPADNNSPKHLHPINEAEAL